MIIYNVTINVDPSILTDWLTWMNNKHIKDVLNTKMFTTARLVKVLSKDVGETTYSVQYTATTRENLERYYNEFAPELREEGMRLFGDKMLAFRTELEVIQEY